MLINLRKTGKYFSQTAKLMIGIPDYDTYVAHMKEKHPEKPIMSYKEFFRERQEARYGGNGKGGFRCC